MIEFVACASATAPGCGKTGRGSSPKVSTTRSSGSWWTGFGTRRDPIQELEDHETAIRIFGETTFVGQLAVLHSPALVPNARTARIPQRPLGGRWLERHGSRALERQLALLAERQQRIATLRLVDRRSASGDSNRTLPGVSRGSTARTRPRKSSGRVNLVAGLLGVAGLAGGAPGGAIKRTHDHGLLLALIEAVALILAAIIVFTIYRRNR